MTMKKLYGIERASRVLSRSVVMPEVKVLDGVHWENDTYYGVLRRYDSGFPLGGGPGALISITALDETARHDWREFQQIKNDLVGPEWEAVELYPAESRLVDPSNRFYLWCVPKGVMSFGFHHRKVLQPIGGMAPQRPFGLKPKVKEAI